MPPVEWASVAVGDGFRWLRLGLKKYRMPQTAQYPKEIPKTKETMMVKSKRKESSNGVITLSFYRTAGALRQSARLE